jgi:hypothetical protein
MSGIWIHWPSIFWRLWVFLIVDKDLDWLNVFPVFFTVQIWRKVGYRLSASFITLGISHRCLVKAVIAFFQRPWKSLDISLLIDRPVAIFLTPSLSIFWTSFQYFSPSGIGAKLVSVQACRFLQVWRLLLSDIAVDPSLVRRYQVASNNTLLARSSKKVFGYYLLANSMSGIQIHWPSIFLTPWQGSGSIERFFTVRICFRLGVWISSIIRCLIMRKLQWVLVNLVG